jgi:hypothetical protein
LWLIGSLCAEKRFNERKRALLKVLEQPDQAQRCEEMSRMLQGGRRGRVERSGDASGKKSAGKTCQQPAALGRLCDMLVQGLDKDSREAAARYPSEHLFATIAIQTADDERRLSGKSGIPMQSRVYPFDCPVLKAAIFEKFGKSPGFQESVAAPLELLLKNEGELGPGVFVPGKCEAGQLFGFYLAEVVSGEPNGRHMVRMIGRKDGLKHVDGAPGSSLPFSVFIERGTPGSLINSSKGRKGKRPNLSLDRENLIRHEWEGRQLVLIPMFALHSFEKAWASWVYDPDAAAGRSF